MKTKTGITVGELKARLAGQPDRTVVVELPDGGVVPRHFHVTEVGHVAKRFLDCGGTLRASETCVLQTWTGRAEDDGHRLTAGKLAQILGLARSILPSDEVPVEVEFEDGVVAQFPVEAVEAPEAGWSGGGQELIVRLGRKHTDCLARESCAAPGSETEAAGCCGATAGMGGGCC